MIKEAESYYAHGKLLLTAEYFVLDGVTALAAPTRLGQHFELAPRWEDSRYDLFWTMHTDKAEEAATFSFIREDWATTQRRDDPIAARLQQLFYAAEQLRPGCTRLFVNHHITTRLEFPSDWGLGSSSTLVSFLADALGVNPYELLELTFGGSGYDLACASAQGPLLYRRSGNHPYVKEVKWRPDWVDQTYFVHRNRKQNSREGIKAYRKSNPSPDIRKEAERLTHAFVEAQHPRTAAQLFVQHEALVAESLQMIPVKQSHFQDFPGEIKSLGAWGGDFVWAISEEPAEKVRAYFNGKGYPTVMAYEEMIG